MKELRLISNSIHTSKRSEVEILLYFDWTSTSLHHRGADTLGWYYSRNYNSWCIKKIKNKLYSAIWNLNEGREGLLCKALFWLLVRIVLPPLHRPLGWYHTYIWCLNALQIKSDFFN